MSNGIIFCDLDGTLIDSRQDLAFSVNEARKEFNLEPLPQEKVVSYVGNGIHKLVERAFFRTGIDSAQALKVLKNIYSSHLLDATSTYPGVREGLEIISSANFAIVVVSNKMQRESIEILNGLGVGGFFSLILGDNGDLKLKPDPEMIFYVRDYLKIPLDNSWIIGDNWTDLECGRRAGIKKAFASYGFGKQKDEKYDFNADSFIKFAEMLRSIAR